MLLDRKLLRDLRALKSQALAVSLVMACGLAMMIMTRSLILSLKTTRDAYYRDYRFADIFARLKRAPDSLRAELAAIPGVGAVQTNIAVQVTLDLPGLAEPAVGLINSLPERGGLPLLNRLYLRTGRLITARDSRGEILVGEAFAEAHALKPGDHIAAILNGHRQSFRVAGIVLSPEFVFEAPPGSALPDNKTYGVFWLPSDELAAAFQLDGAFNQVALTLAPGASESRVIAAVDRVLAPYGNRGAYGRANHPSHTRLSDELRVLHALSFAYPIVFLGVAAFMTNAVLSRQITLQREQIAILKAFGFTDREIGGHYFRFAIAIVAAGLLFGTAGGIAFGEKIVDIYHVFFRFPHLGFLLPWDVLLAAALACAAAAVVGVFGSVRAAVRLPPAEAMRPEPPSSYRPALVERLPLARRLPVSLRMALRHIERRPVRSLLTIAVLALATGLLIMPHAFRDGIAYILDFQWDIVQRQTVTVALADPAPPRALADFRHLPGVVHAEPVRSAPVELISANHSRRLGILGLPPRAFLQRVLDSRLRQQTLPDRGLVVSAKLAEILDLRPGDPVTLHFLEGDQRTVTVPLAGTAEDFAGVAAYMDLSALDRLLGEGDRITGALLTVRQGAWSDFLDAIKHTPRTSSVVIKDSIRASFRETTARSIGILQTVYLAFAVIVAFGIVYNSARIALSERSRELATLRVLGFTRREVGAVLVSELVFLTLAALPAGLLVGVGLVHFIIDSVNTETVRLPIVLEPSNFAFAILIVCLASFASMFLATRRLHQLDLVAALKARD